VPTTTHRRNTDANHTHPTGTIEDLPTGFLPRWGFLKDGRAFAGPGPHGPGCRYAAPGHPPYPGQAVSGVPDVEIRTVNGRRATDRAGAAEVLGVSTQTVALRASPKQRRTSGFPGSIGTEDRRDWYALDDLDAHADAWREQHPETPRRAPAWLRDGPDEELLPATTFRAAAGVQQGTWKRYVQRSMPDWKEHRDGYLPQPDDEEDYRGTGKRYFWKRARMIAWLDNRPGERAGAGRKGGGTSPTIADAVNALRGAGGELSYTELATALGVSHSLAQYLLKQARERLNVPAGQ
jgi:hypothetical protein